MPWALNIWPRRPNAEGRDNQKFPKHVRVKPLTIEHPVLMSPKALAKRKARQARKAQAKQSGSKAVKKDPDAFRAALAKAIGPKAAKQYIARQRNQEAKKK
jgi:hypothetical protein